VEVQKRTMIRDALLIVGMLVLMGVLLWLAPGPW
jgi:hypothetical protein